MSRTLKPVRRGPYTNAHWAPMRTLLLVSLALAPISTLESQQPPTGSIEGVVSAPSGVPLANALVVLMGHPLATLSSDFGVFRFCAVPAAHMMSGSPGSGTGELSCRTCPSIRVRWCEWR